MKKLLMAMAAVAMVGAANAAAAYNYKYLLYVSRYNAKDTTGCEEHASWYNCYAMTQATARDLLGASTAVTYSDVATWLGQNFTANSASVVSRSQALTLFESYESRWSQYKFKDYNLSELGSACNDSVSVVLFNNGTDLAYNVMGMLDARSYFSFDDTKTGTSNGWVAVENTPEPTSGLLLLLGMAGLALKRKRA